MGSNGTDVINTTLLLHPQHIAGTKALWELMLREKTDKGILVTGTALTDKKVEDHFYSLPETARKLLKSTSPRGLEKRDSDIKAGFRNGHGKMDFADLERKAILHFWHDCLIRLKPYLHLWKWYHKVWVDNRSASVAPCHFSTWRPGLCFTLYKEKQQLSLTTYVDLNGTLYPLTDFQRFGFLLLSKNEYFILGWKEFQTLERLQQDPPENYFTDLSKLNEHILARLEEDYSVKREGDFNEQKIEVLPVNRVMLQEISDSFLMLTPQWVYEGFVVESQFPDPYEVTDRGERLIIHRNKAAENEFRNFLESLHPRFPKQMNGTYNLSFSDAQKKQWFLKTWYLLLEKQIEIVGMDLLKHFRYSPHSPETTINIIEEDQTLLVLDFTLKFGKETVELSALQKMLLAGQKAVVLKDGSLGVLSEEWQQQFGYLVKHGKISQGTLRVARWIALTERQNAGYNASLNPVFKEDWWKKWKLWQESNEPIYSLPTTVQATLRPYQHKGFEWMLLLAEAGAGACLADDMGLGKTLQTISVIAQHHENFSDRKHLVVCPSGLLYNWLQEFQRFAPALSVLVHHGPQRDAALISEGKHQVILTSYGTLRSDLEHLAPFPFHTVVIDESHNIKNPVAQITKAVGHIRADFRMALSGTPVLNNTFDLYAQLNFLLPGLFGGREFFKKEYADPIDRDQDPEKTEALKRITLPFILRRTKEQVATDLPDKTESILWCEMGDAQRICYEEIRDQIQQNIFMDIKEKGLNNGKLSVINGLLKLRQVCNSPELVKEEGLTVTASVKTEMLLSELLQTVPQHKALVFSQFTSMLDLLEPKLNEAGLKFYRIDGSVTGPKRQEIVNQFQEEGNEVPVLLISLKAGNAGLNLTAADYVFLFDPWWNTAVQQQAIDRTHRIGQTKKVFAYKMICRDSIEERIIQLQERKKKLSDELIGEDNGFVKSLSEEDIRFLFS